MFKQLILISSSIIAIVLSASLPSTFQRCAIKDSACLKDSIENAIKQLANGNKELGVRSIDPLEIKSMHVPGHGGQVDLDQKYSNIKLNGASESKVNKFDIDLDKCIMKGEAIIPSLNVVGDYVLKGQLLVFPINGRGVSNNTFNNIKVTFNIICDKVKKNGEEYINVKDLELTLDPESINFEYENVVDNEEISNQIRKVLNENSKIIFDDVKKDYETSYGLVFQDYAKRIFDKIPIKGIFLL